MDFDWPGDDDLRRVEIRQWLAQHNGDPSQEALARSGYVAPHWPKPYGLDADPIHQLIIDEELAAAGVKRAAGGIGLGWAGPTILFGGTREQQDRYLWPILTGEEIWCQLFSEPGSGSDLAGATTRADLRGDEWIINGQKVWNTSAHHADFGLLLARSDWDEPKHKGLSYFVLDMRQPGVEVRQLKQMNGHASFNEVFFTDARVPRANLIGQPGDGWQIAMTTLAHERRSFDRPRNPAAKAVSPAPIYQQYQEELEIANEPYKWYPQRAGRVDLILQRANETGAINDPVLRQDIARLHILASSAHWTAQRARAAQKAGKSQGPEGSLGKLAASHVGRLAAQVHTHISANDALLTGPDSPMDGTIAKILVSTPAGSIAGGTDEIQRNIIAERLLGLPRK